MTEPNESIMTRVMKLLSLAEDDRTPPHEAKNARARAEKLMAQHMIDEYEARQRLKDGDTSARKPVQDEWFVASTEAHSEERGRDVFEFDYQIISMMKYVLEHCNVRVNDNYKFQKGGRLYQIVGFRDDITYAERIWFNVFKTFVQNVNPSWDKDRSVGYNAYNFACAGLSWQQITLVAEKAGDTRVPWVDRWQDTDPGKPFYLAHETFSKRVGDMITKETADDPNKWNFGLGAAIKLLRGQARVYAVKQELAMSYTRGDRLRIASRNSFARSYRATITSRLDDIRKEATTGEDHVDAGKFALALRDTRERVDEEFYNVFPEFDPEVRKRKREEEEFLRAAAWAALTPSEQAKVLRDIAREERAYQKRRATTRTRYRAIREDPADRYDAAAWARGQSAAKSVNLRADEEVPKQNRKELG